MKAYIYTHGTPMMDGFRWFIDYHNNLAEAEEAAPEGFTVDLFTSTKQYLG